MKKKKLVTALLILAILAALFFIGCVSHPSPFGEVTLHYHYGEVNVDEALSLDEAREMRRILSGNINHFDCGEANAGWSCGYTENVSVEIGGVRFCPANDTCTGVYGGHFPCI